MAKIIKKRILQLNSPIQLLSIEPPFMLFCAELGELGICQVLSLQVTLSDWNEAAVVAQPAYVVLAPKGR